MGFGIAALLLTLAQVAPVAGLPPEEIVVTGDAGAGRADTKPRIVLGSRLPRYSLQGSRYIASGTSLGGLTKDSGIDAGERTRTLRIKRCQASGATLSKLAACALSDVQKAMEAGDLVKAKALAETLAARSDLTAEDRFVTQTFLYRIAEARRDEGERRRLLQSLADSDYLSPEDRLTALRSLAGYDAKEGREAAALQRYQTIAALDPEDARSRMNAAALLQRAGREPEAKLKVREAIGIVTRAGQPIPAQWSDLAR